MTGKNDNENKSSNNLNGDDRQVITRLAVGLQNSTRQSDRNKKTNEILGYMGRNIFNNLEDVNRDDIALPYFKFTHSLLLYTFVL